jgi:hypothetical protein
MACAFALAVGEVERRGAVRRAPREFMGVSCLPAAPDCFITGPTHATSNCFTDGIGAHGNNERCSMRAVIDLTVSATQYDVEQFFDYVSIYIGGRVTRYSGGMCTNARRMRARAPMQHTPH